MGKATLELARELNVPHWKLYNIVRERRIPEPPRLGARGAFVWMPENIEAVKRVLAAKNNPAA